ncbi:MAG: hypothetical protein QOF75_2726, partial [Gaiellaceae bacterium]|nr:hypothetical protein [Gaiellaceae bacterium]
MRSTFFTVVVAGATCFAIAAIPFENSER